MDTPMVVETGNNGFGGFGGAGWMGALGGLILGSMWGGNGWWGGNNRGAGQAAADVTLASGIQNLSNQAQQNAISTLQSANGVAMQVANSAADTTQAINQNTISALQSNAGLSQQLCCSTGRLSQEIDATGDQTVAAINQANIQSMQNTQLMADRLCGVNQNISSQGYETRLLAQQLASQLQAQHADLKATIQNENCQDRELMREIAAQAVRDKLAETEAALQAKTAEINLTNQLSNQTLYLISQLKTTTTTAAGA